MSSDKVHPGRINMSNLVVTVLGYHKILLLFQVAFASGNWGVLGF